MLCAISDIHGHLHALEEALENVSLSGDNRLVLLGDYIDYGPRSGEVLRSIYDLQQRQGPEKVVVLRGNHEDAFLEWLDTYGGPQAGQPDEYGLLPWNGWLEHDRDFGTLRTLISPEQWAFFARVLPTLSDDTRSMEAARMILSENGELIAWLRALPYYFETDRQIFVHAGVDEEAGEWWPQVTRESDFVGRFPARGPFYKDVVAGHVGTDRLAGNPEYHGVYFDGRSHYYIDGSVQRGGRLNILAWDEKNETYAQWDNNGWKKEMLTE